MSKPEPLRERAERAISGSPTCAKLLELERCFDMEEFIAVYFATIEPAEPIPGDGVWVIVGDVPTDLILATFGDDLDHILEVYANRLETYAFHLHGNHSEMTEYFNTPGVRRNMLTAKRLELADMALSRSIVIRDEILPALC